MKTKNSVSILLLCLGAVILSASAGFAASADGAAGLTPTYLRCEYRVDPLGIDAARPRLFWIVESGERAQKQSAYQIIVSGSMANLDKDTGDAWDSGKVLSEETAQIEYAGKPLESRRQYFWKVRVWDANGRQSAWSKPAMWSMGLLNPGDWQAKWIGYDTKVSKKQQLDEQLATISRSAGKKTYLPCPWLRKSFNVNKNVRRATVYVTALGFFELHINGSRVGRDFLTPGWTDYNKRVYYLTYDVTPLLRAGGANAMGAILSDGWYAGNVGGRGQRFYGASLRLRAQLHIEYGDGTEQVVATDDTWRAANGPIREADMQAGETYDARLEMPGWSEPGFDDSSWKPVPRADDYAGAVQAYPGIPVRKIMEIKPVELTEPQPGVFIFHMGQNFAGVVRLKVRGSAGDKIVLRFGEMLNPDGTLYTTNLRGARVIDTYILKGGGEEVWEPRFTFHGFQYVEVTGFPGRPGLDAITGVVMSSDLPQTGSFESSSPLLNKLFSNIVWGQRSNYVDVPTDCPQRDERLGWMGDAQVFAGTAAYNMDVSAFFTKWMVDVEDAQLDDGHFTDTSPRVVEGGAAGWADAGIICPWTIHRMYGDTRIITRHYDSMTKYIKFLVGRSEKNLAPPLGSYGDWLNVNAHTDVGLISTAYYARSVTLMSEMADAVGKTADAEKEREIFGRIKKAFRGYYLLGDGQVMGDTQTGYLLALHFGLLPDSMRGAAEAHLIDRIRDRDWSLSTGFIGVNLLLPTLTEIGRADVAYRLITNRKYPSWGYSIDQGATTVWERWNSYTKENGFGDPGMNSFNHYAYGSAGEWMFSTLAGIDTDGPGFKRILIHPRPGGGIDFARAAYDSIRGRIETEWKIIGEDIVLNVTIPANTTAAVFVPAAKETDVLESGLPAASAPGVKFLRMEAGAAVFEAGSGKYSFVSKNGKSNITPEIKD